MTITLRIRAARDAKGLSQAEVAARGKIRLATLSAYERNPRRVDLDILERIAQGIGVDPMELIEHVPAGKRRK